MISAALELNSLPAPAHGWKPWRRECATEVKVTKANSSREQPNTQSWNQIAPYAFPSLVGFLFVLLFLWLLLWNAERLVALALLVTCTMTRENHLRL
jgi:hypothetical protein